MLIVAGECLSRSIQTMSCAKHYMEMHPLQANEFGDIYHLSIILIFDIDIPISTDLSNLALNFKLF